MPGHTDAVLHLSYFPDGKRLASGGGYLAVIFYYASLNLFHLLFKGAILECDYLDAGSYMYGSQTPRSLHIMDTRC
jgi:hypothetical protein